MNEGEQKCNANTRNLVKLGTKSKLVEILNLNRRGGTPQPNKDKQTHFA